ncbi:hypothetical protein ACVCAH_20735 [Micromonospora sp. LZ34]
MRAFAAMGDFEQIYVSHHQFVVSSDPGDYLGLYTVGDGLVHVTGAGALTVMTGPHSAPVRVRVAVLTEAAAPDDGWDAVSEATLWHSGEHFSVHGLMGDAPNAFRSIAAPGPGLLRVQVRARDRQPEGSAAEAYEVLVWPVHEDLGLRTLRDDGKESPWTQRADKAAAWAMVRLVTAANRGTEPRFDIRRAVPPGWSGVPDLVLPAGEVLARLEGGRWRWSTVGEPTATATATATVPDESDSVVERDGDTLVHRGVLASQVPLLGLVWDHLRRHPEPPYPWERELAERAAKAGAVRRRLEEAEARRWGGRLPSQRIRSLPANVWSLARMDRELLDLLEGATPQHQRAFALWATRRACAVSRLDTVDWIAHALAAVELGDPTPPPFDDMGATWERLFADPRVPSTVVTLPDGTPNCSQQAMALPAMFAVTYEDPLAAAVETVFCAAIAHGPEHRRLLSDARALLVGPPDLGAGRT